MLLNRALQHPRALLTWALAVVVAGVWAASRLPVEWVPSVELPTVTLSAVWPGASPQAVERYVTAPIERTLRGVSGTAGVESYSQEGQAFLRLEVSRDRDLGLYVAEVSDRLAALRASLPDRVVPRLTHEVPEALRDEQGFMTLQLFGLASPQALRRRAEERLAPALRSLAGVAGVTVEGGEEPELLIAFDRDRLALFHLSVEEIRDRLAEILASRSYGWLQSRGGQSLLLQPGRERAAGVAGLTLAADPKTGALVRLSDVATITLGPAPVRTMSRVDGNPVVTLRLDRSPGSHLLATAVAVRSALADLRADLPASMEILVADDRSEDVNRELRDLAVRGGLGLLAILTVLIAMLDSARGAGAVLASAVFTLSAALALMHPLGLTFNLLTLAGLVLLFGLVVDNAVVVVAQLLSERSSDPASGAGAYVRTATRALSAVGLPLAGCTATTAVVFLPVASMSGELRSLFAPFAVLATVTLAVSLLSAVLVVPALGRYLPRPAPSRRTHGRLARRLVLAPYHLASRHPRTTLLLLALAVGLPTPLLPDSLEEPEGGWPTIEEEQAADRYNQTWGSDTVRGLRRWIDPLLGGVTRPFLEEVELDRGMDFEARPELAVRLKLRPGSGIERADEMIHGFEELALAARSAERILCRVSEDLAVLRVIFPEDALQSTAPLLLRERLINRALSIADVEVSVSGILPTGFHSGLGDVTGLPVEAFGPSYDRLQEVAASFAQRLERDLRVAGVDIHAGRPGQPSGREVLRLRWGADAVARTGAQAREVAGLLRSRLATRVPSFYAPLEGDPRLPVRLVTADAEEQELEQLLGAPLTRVTDGPLRLAGLANVTAERQPAAIERQDQQYKRYIQVFYRGPYRLGTGLIDREIKALELPPGFRLERPQPSFFNADTRSDIVWALLGGIGLVLLVLAAVLESWTLAGWVLLSLPLAWVGIALGFLSSGEGFAEGAFLGVLLTVGIAVNGSLLIADRFRRLRLARPTAPLSTLALLALRNRLRPMWTTVLTAIAGMLPTLVLPGSNPFWVGLSIAVVGGLLTSSLLGPAALVALLSAAKPSRGESFAAVTGEERAA